MNSSNTQAAVNRLNALKQDVAFSVEDAGFASNLVCGLICDKWIEQIESGSTDSLIRDLDLLVLRLQRFQRKARIALPVPNGGLGGQNPNALRQRLLSLGLGVTQTSNGLFTYPGSVVDFDYEEEALAAAMQEHQRFQSRVIGVMPLALGEAA